MINRRTLLTRSLTAATVGGLNSLCSLSQAQQPRTLQPYGSEAELQAALTRWRQAAQATSQRSGQVQAEMASSMPLSAPAAKGAAADSSAASNDSGMAKQSITNNQTAGVDEGGIVKVHGEHLVILRRGRLFTVRVGGNALEPQSMVDAYGPGARPTGAWYDELLVSDNTVVVIGYSYARGGTEIGLFEISRDGGLSYRATYHLRSFDYYSSRNYASRLVGRQLIFYTQLLLRPWDTQASMPAVRRWHEDNTGDFQRILPATRVYRTDDEIDPGKPLALHTITTCDLGSDEMRCESTAVLAPPGRVFYVSAGSVYVWTHTQHSRSHRPTQAPTETSAVFRIPLNASAPSALKTSGVPIDQMSFLEDANHLNVLLSREGSGESMWGAEQSRVGSLALLRVPLTAFGNGTEAAQAEHYQRLPAAGPGALRNRYVGNWLIYCAQKAWALRPGTEPVALAPGHAVERIEALGAQMAVLVGNPRNGS